MDKIIFDKLNLLSEAIGRTPLKSLGNGIYAKIEGENPAGSVKDRVAFYIIKNALEAGVLKEGAPVVEATSGNTGIGLAYVGRELGIRVVLTMPESMSKERRELLASYGAELVLTPAAEGMNGAVAEARRTAEREHGFFADQFGNPSSVQAHYETTAPEIFAQLPGVRAVVAGVGSGGTATGIADYIARNGLDCKVFAVEPAESPLLSRGIAGAHLIQGIGANFVPPIVDVSKFCGIITVRGAEAVKEVTELYRGYGIKCGISSGAAMLAAYKLRAAVEGDILAVFPDGGDRYDAALYR